MRGAIYRQNRSPAWQKPFYAVMRCEPFVGQSAGYVRSRLANLRKPKKPQTHHVRLPNWLRRAAKTGELPMKETHESGDR